MRVVAAVAAGLLLFACPIRQQSRREGDKPGTVITNLDKTCGEPPDNIKSDEAMKVRAAIEGAMKNASVEGKATASFESEFKKQLEQTGRSSTLANDIQLVQYSVCEQCLTLALSPEQCAKARSEALKVYQEISVKK